MTLSESSKKCRKSKEYIQYLLLVKDKDSRDVLAHIFRLDLSLLTSCMLDDYPSDHQNRDAIHEKYAKNMFDYFFQSKKYLEI